MKTKNWIGISLILAFVCMLIFSGIYSDHKTNTSPQPVNGYLDLSEWSFENDGPVDLSGEWKFYFNEFIDPEKFAENEVNNASQIQIPSTNDSMNLVKPFESDKYYGTLYLRVKLPSNSENYGLTTDIVLSSYKLFINGKFFEEVGHVGTSSETSDPYYKLVNSYFSADSAIVDIVIHTSDFHYEDSAITTPKIGLASQIASSSTMKLSRDFFLFGMLVIMGIYHIGLFVMRTKDRTSLYFGIFNLMFAFRMLIVGARFLPSHYEMNFEIYGRLSYLTVYFGFTGLCGYLYYSFKELLSDMFFKLSIGSGIIITLITLVSPFKIIDTTIFYYIVFGFILLFYALIMIFKGFIKGVPYTGEVIVGFICLILGFANDYYYELTISNTPSMIPFALSIFVLTQAYMLASKFSLAFSSIENLSNENSQILEDLKHVNSNLEFLVDERTADLKKALDELDHLSKTDYLTKLPNRRHTIETINEIIANRKPFFVGIVDIDHFKTVNDTYGHDCGDMILKELSDLLVAEIKDEGFVGRWGGEEFLILLYYDHQDIALKRIDALRARLASHKYSCIMFPITVTVGLCKYTDKMTVDMCIDYADKALYRGKENGRNKSCMYERLP